VTGADERLDHRLGFCLRSTLLCFLRRELLGGSGGGHQRLILKNVKVWALLRE
jgi:hypothetical protein